MRLGGDGGDNTAVSFGMDRKAPVDARRVGARVEVFAGIVRRTEVIERRHHRIDVRARSRHSSWTCFCAIDFRLCPHRAERRRQQRHRGGGRTRAIPIHPPVYRRFVSKTVLRRRYGCVTSNGCHTFAQKAGVGPRE